VGHRWERIAGRERIAGSEAKLGEQCYKKITMTTVVSRKMNVLIKAKILAVVP